MMMLINFVNIIKKYNQELVGNGLGNFHIDLPQKDGYKDVYAIESLFLGKKTYIDSLEYVNDEGDKTHDLHIRMRGVPASCIKYEASKKKITVLDLYKNLYKGAVIEFDLTNDDSKFVCRNSKDHTIKTLHKEDKGSSRRCKFIRDDEDKIFIN